MNERIELVPCDSDRVGSRCGLNQLTRDDSFARVTINSFSASKFVFRAMQEMYDTKNNERKCRACARYDNYFPQLYEPDRTAISTTVSI